MKFKEEVKDSMEEMERYCSRNEPDNVDHFLEAQQKHSKPLIQEENIWKQHAKMH